MKSLQCIDFNIFAEIITGMVENAFSAGLPMWSGRAGEAIFRGTNARIADVALTEVSVVTRHK